MTASLNGSYTLIQIAELGLMQRDYMKLISAIADLVGWVDEGNPTPSELGTQIKCGRIGIG
jgi:hypothetical protein